MAQSYGMLGYGAPAPQGAAPIDRYGYIRQPTLRVATGPATSLRYGRSWRAASAAQKANRAQDRYTGRGRYRRRRRKRRRYYGRRRRRYRGRGLYHGRGGFWGDLWKATKTPLLNAAQAGIATIPKYGGVLSTAFGGIRKASGIGDYTVATNALVSGGGSGTFEAPTFTEISDTGGIMISHREYVGNIYAPAEGVDFEVQTFTINPGMEETWPWLAQIAANYEEYEMGQLMFSFKSTVSSFQTETGVVGTVLTATQYNQLQRPFEDKKSIMETHGSSSCKSTDNLITGVECDPDKLAQTKNKYVRTQGMEIDRQLPRERYDLGRFCVGLADFPDKLADQAIGELWVTYTVKLLRPRVYTGRGDAISTDLHYLTLPSALTGQWPAPGDPAAIPLLTEAPHIDLDCALGLSATNQIQGNCFLWSDKLSQNYFLNSQNSIGCEIRSGPVVNVILGTSPSGAAPNPGQPVVFTGPAPTGTSPTKEIASSSSVFVSGTTTFTLGIAKASGVQIIFPARFAGTLRIKYEVMWFSATNTAANIAQFATLLSQGNVSGVFDMLTPWTSADLTGTTAANAALDRCQSSVNAATCLSMGAAAEQTAGKYVGTAAPGSAGTAAVSGNRAFIEAHVSVRPATDGLDNILEIRGLFWGSDTKGPQLQASTVALSIEEYNSTLSDNKDVPSIVHAQTGLPLVQQRDSLGADPAVPGP